MIKVDEGWLGLVMQLRNGFVAGGPALGLTLVVGVRSGLDLPASFLKSE